MAVINISSGGENINGESILGVDINLGKEHNFNTNDSVDQNVLGVDQSLGANKTAPDANYSINDITVSNPSGYNADGSPEWGDGKISRTTTWADDHEKTEEGELNYFTPSAIQSKDYNELSN